jgi:HEAT repeat protein
MAKRLSLKDKTAKLEAFKAGPLPPDAAEELRKFLADANHIVAAEAADIIKKFELSDLTPDLVTAFNGLIIKPAKADVGCMAKTAIVKALDTLHYNDADDVFYRGIHHVQQEPAYKGHIDTAAELRGRCALALARIVHHEIFFLLTTLLMDPEPQARVEAVRSLVYLGTHESELLLRMKVLAGESHPDILSQCLSGLVQVNPDRSVEFVARFLDSTDLITAEDAAIALGESRNHRAFEILCEHRAVTFKAKLKQMLLLPIALTRLDEAFDYLIDVIDNENEESAAYAVETLRVFGIDEARRERIQQAVTSREKRAITEAYEKYFSP